MLPNWFVALPAPATGWFIERVALCPPPQVRLFHPDDLHLTVAFLGRVDEQAARRAWELRERWCAGPVRVGLGEVVAMGPPVRYSALSALLERGRGEVEAGMSACRDPMLAAASAPSEFRVIKAHLTIGRPRRDATPAQRSAALTWAMHLPLRDVELELTELALYTWDEQRNERQFHLAERAPL